MSEHDFTQPSRRRQYVVLGGTALKGTVRVSGLARSAFSVLSAATLCSAPVTVRNVPDTEEIRLFLDLLSGLGHTVSFPEAGDRHTVLLCPENGRDPVRATAGPGRILRRLPGSLCLLGSLLGRYGRAVWEGLPFSGTLGIHPLTEHLKGFEQMGAEWRLTGDVLELRAEQGLRGCTIRMKYPSPFLTANLMQAAVAAEGRTVLENVPDDPAVRDLAAFLNAAGAEIRGAGSETIEIEGVPLSRLRGTEFTLVPDAEEAGVYLCMAAATGGDVTVEGVTAEQMAPLTAVLGSMGAGVSFPTDRSALRLTAELPLRPFRAEAGPWSLIRIPLLTNLAVCAAMADGVSVLTDRQEGAFLSRASEQLSWMGADLSAAGRDSQETEIRGTGRLHGAEVSAFARVMLSGLITAGLAAWGTTTVDVPRGRLCPYDHFTEKVRSLGGHLELRETEEI